MINLSKQQEEAVDHLDGPCLVTSVPGSGKTRVLTERAIKLIQKGVNPKNILCITFTNKAAKEMKNRISSRLGNSNSGMFVGTFHAFCANIIRTYGTKIGYDKNVTILDSDSQKALVKKIIRMNYVVESLDSKDIDYFIHQLNTKRENVEPLDEIIADFKKSSHPIQADIAEKYFDKIKESNLVDFSGLLYETINILENNPNVLNKLQQFFKYIQIDEVQDTNYAQYKIINLLAGSHKNVMLIGDLQQSIYRFRGARYQNILDFLSSNTNCRQITLGKNYRSTPEIVKVADKLIKHNKNNMVDKFETDNPSGNKVICQILTTQSDEADWVKKKIKELVHDYGWDYSDIAVLYRLNRLSLDIQTSLAKDGIPYRVIGGPNYFDRREIKDCLSMLGFLSNKLDSVSFHRISKIFSSIGDKTIGEIESYSAQNKIDLYTSCEKLKDCGNVRVKKLANHICDIYGKDFNGKHAGESLSDLIKHFDYFVKLNTGAKSSSEYIDRKGNVEELIIHASEFGKCNSSVQDYLNNIALITVGDEDSENNSVTLMTIHASKGLEFPIVFMIGMEDDILPHSLAIFESDDIAERDEAMQEERRICYVAMTRAMKHLNLSYCRYRKKRYKDGSISDQKKKPSKFLLESGLIDDDEYNKG